MKMLLTITLSADALLFIWLIVTAIRDRRGK